MYLDGKMVLMSNADYNPVFMPVRALDVFGLG